MPRQPRAPLSGPVFAEPSPTPDQTTFSTPHPSDNSTYSQIEDLLTKDTVSFPNSTGNLNDIWSLSDALGPQGPAIVQQIQSAGQIVFHAVGDTGASQQSKYPNEVSVADALSGDYNTSTGADVPSFFFHLGDVVYNFGESQYYYDQFYEPYRNYPAPIIAIPGNHDSFIVPGTDDADDPLTIFMRNFCSNQPVITQEAGSLHRTAMTAPGVYFALDAPFVRIIALFSNSLEDPGLISSENGNWPGVPDVQLDFLTAQLQRAQSENYSGALIVATHHPSFVYTPDASAGGSGGNHGSSPNMLAQIDTICAQVGIYPHAFLSGHSHNYQRFTRTIQMNGVTLQVPFIVAGCGGHNVNPIVSASNGQEPTEPSPGTDVSYMDTSTVVTTNGLSLDAYDDTDYGYLRITATADNLQIDFHQLPQNRKKLRRTKHKDSVVISHKHHNQHRRKA